MTKLYSYYCSHTMAEFGKYRSTACRIFKTQPRPCRLSNTNASSACETWRDMRHEEVYIKVQGFWVPDLCGSTTVEHKTRVALVKCRGTMSSAPRKQGRNPGRGPKHHHKTVEPLSRTLFNMWPTYSWQTPCHYCLPGCRNKAMSRDDHCNLHGIGNIEQSRVEYSTRGRHS